MMTEQPHVLSVSYVWTSYNVKKMKKEAALSYCHKFEIGREKNWKTVNFSSTATILNF